MKISYFLVIADALYQAMAGQCSGGMQVASQGDAERLSKCGKYSGNISVIQLNLEEVDFGNLSEVDGNITIENNFNLKSILLEGLAILNGTLKLKDNIQLLGLSIPKLHSVRKLQVSNTPNLNTLNMDKISTAESIEISQTAITDISGLSVKQCESIIFSNNIYLKDIKMGNLTLVKKQFTIIDNNQQSTASFPMLEMIGGNSTIQGLSELSLPKLKSVSESVTFIENQFTSLQLDSLTNLEMDLNIIQNKQLTQISFPQLKEIKKALVIQNNTELAEINKNSFPKLTKVGEKILITGPFKEIAFPSLKMVNKAVTITSTEKLDCPSLKKEFSFLNSNMWICKTTSSTGKQESKTNKGTGSSGSVDSDAQKSSAAALKYFNLNKSIGTLAFALLLTTILF
ncbi:hypothetical protein BB561_005329 [Smittium simulii]|uniref:Receptor L-domain domain-containing protein n=1 Tax=Smittium simulii TaxID=133385 RepID=A0A2T9YAY1_9FUNG|nr:hypothetical protein BB561_005329 [Smittium simulii]